MPTDKKRVQAFLSESLSESLSEYASSRDLSIASAIAEILESFFSGSGKSGAIPLDLEQKIESRFQRLESQVYQLRKLAGLISPERYAELQIEGESLSEPPSEPLSESLDESESESDSEPLSESLDESESESPGEPPSESFSEPPSEPLSESFSELSSESPSESLSESPKEQWVICQVENKAPVAYWTGAKFNESSEARRIYQSEGTAKGTIVKIQKKFPSLSLSYGQIEGGRLIIRR